MGAGDHEACHDEVEAAHPVEANSGKAQDVTESQTEDCRCPSHQFSCCNAPIILFKEAATLSLRLTDRQSFREAKIIFPQGPWIDGPFQPPRA